ncbi:type II secretion pathway component PulD-like protein [Streptobacillus moniliformis]|uniref:Type II secretory pathway component PulD-like protein n=1 Tax=Streptobacillus moniliformis (strain ATCC 14647 / DSM 12112 / NCTC 10651 / 9901) TaxID=519441 RepID=D1AWQ5_STRM9|nr:type II secretion pathway component PulD-like protein [Streptobacillus moniliformis]ACZ00731.1 Type II secretory pathway component PulD-like protein [Streptobacillus moniliformis DSM 12112]AVL42873.1 hypothetical protein CEP89_03015 [Streptobacillus moniliformis]QXW65487.1 type II and III secretion system protein [Streptobacillus moniliformis]SQA14140.1 Type II secretory pathway, component HofQ [Streptobacillus moniliformis]
MKKLLIFLTLLTFSDNKYISNENMKKIKIYNEKKVEIKNKEVKKVEEVYEILKIQNIPENEILKLDGSFGVKIRKVGDKYILSGEKKNISKLKHIIYSIDKIKKQIIIKMNVIDTSISFFDRFGLNLKLEENKNDGLVAKFLENKLSLSNLLNLGGAKLGLDIEALKQSGDMYIKSFPSIMVLDNSEGEMRITDELSFKVSEKKVQTSEAGLIFKIKPRIVTKGYKEFVELEIYSEISSFKSEKVRSKNILNTKVLLKDKTSTFISGVGRESKSINISNPSIPIFSTLFRKKSKNKEKRNIYVEVEVEILNE